MSAGIARICKRCHGFLEAARRLTHPYMPASTCGHSTGSEPTMSRYLRNRTCAVGRPTSRRGHPLRQPRGPRRRRSRLAAGHGLDAARPGQSSRRSRCKTAVPVEHRVLPGAADIISGDRRTFESAVRSHAFDVIVCLDASSPDRMGSAYNPDVHESATLVVIDHHITNTLLRRHQLGGRRLRLHLPDACLSWPMRSASRLTASWRECLLTGMVTDTLGFRTSNTTPDVLGAAMRLMQGGADLTDHHPAHRQPPPVQRDQAVGKGAAGRAARGWRDLDDRRTGDAAAAGSGEQRHQPQQFPGYRDEADISAVFTETTTGDDVPVVECSFRAKPGFDVSQVAFSLGGGGHPAASGCTIPGPLPDAIARVIPALQERVGTSGLRTTERSPEPCLSRTARTRACSSSTNPATRVILPTRQVTILSLRSAAGAASAASAILARWTPWPAACSVLCLGRATRLVEYYQGHDKQYLADVALGAATDTYDAAGRSHPRAPYPHSTRTTWSES